MPFGSFHDSKEVVKTKTTTTTRRKRNHQRRFNRCHYSSSCYRRCCWWWWCRLHTSSSSGQSGIQRIISFLLSWWLLLMSFPKSGVTLARGAGWVPCPTTAWMTRGRRLDRNHYPRQTNSRPLFFYNNNDNYFNHDHRPLSTCRLPTNPTNFNKRRSRPFTSSSSPLFMAMKQWNVGDVVAVTMKSSTTPLVGVIQAVSGGGWYAVQILSEEDRKQPPSSGTVPNSILKCRSSQLNPLEDSLPSIHDRRTNSTPSVNSSQTFSPSQKSRPIVHLESAGEEEGGREGSSLIVVSPPPTMYDLDATLLDRHEVQHLRDLEYLEQVQHHTTYDKWVVFTDLHCSPSSLDTCLKVLARVHELAVERKAGVLFLGDFWHHRGTLRVDCLNAVLEHFRTWTVPMVMIPGNHDQVTLDGHIHGLTPFENAYRVTTNSTASGSVPGPLIFSYPTKFRNALFVPHIRNIATMESILQSSLAKESSALFVHAEVTGALMNDLIVSLDGIPPTSFPVHKRIYSGHFHKPHTVKATHHSSNPHHYQNENGGSEIDRRIQIEYLGSPYETSLSEAQQAKTLAVLDANWDCIEYIPIDIGRRHFKVSSWTALSELTMPVDDKVESKRGSGHVRWGDRIVVTIPQDEMRNQTTDSTEHLKQLRTGGIMVEIREIKKTAQQALGLATSATDGGTERLEAMSPETTWRAYLHEEEHERQTLTNDTFQVLLEEGLKIVNEVEATEDVKSEQERAHCNLSLKRVSVEGFGPFRGKTTYPLSDRGLVLLKGTNNDGGSDSNGSGKSSLAMASLWALTGSMDPRRAQDGRVSDVIHDESKVARVTVDGTMNGKPFSISRSKTASKNGLVFHLDGEDLTRQSVKETQQMMEEVLGVNIDILSRTMFHGQHTVNDLLEATDTQLKDELSLLVPLKLWQTATSIARAKGRTAVKKSSELSGMITLREQDLQRLIEKLRRAETAAQEKQKSLSRLEALYETERTAVLHEENILVDFQELEAMLEGIESDLRSLAKSHEEFELEREAALSPLRETLHSSQDMYDELTKTVQQDEREEYAATLNLQLATERVRQMELKWSVDLKDDTSKFSAPDVCPTCHQPIGDGHSHETFEQLMTRDIEDSIARRSSAQDRLVNIQTTTEQHRIELKSQEALLTSERRIFDETTLEWLTKISELQVASEGKRRERQTITEQMAAKAKLSQTRSKLESLQASIQLEKAATEYAQRTVSDIEEEIEEVQQRLQGMKIELEAENKLGHVMGDLSDRFGQRGVQTFVLQNVVDVLQVCSQTYLDDLSDGSQRLDLALDAGDRISRTAYVVGADGIYKERPLATLSGGQWRRCSLALTFGFAELVARRGKFRPSLCVLDEPLTHLDRSGRAKVGEVLRKMLRGGSPTDRDNVDGFGAMSMSTVLIILQDLAAEELDEAFDCIDEVIKEDSQSRVKIDGFRAMK